MKKCHIVDLSVKWLSDFSYVAVKDVKVKAFLGIIMIINMFYVEFFVII